MNDLIILTFDEQAKVAAARKHIQDYGKEQLLVFDGTTALGQNDVVDVQGHKRRWWLRAPAAVGEQMITAVRYTLALTILAAGTLAVQYANYIANDDDDDNPSNANRTPRTEALFLIATEDLPDELLIALQRYATTMTQTSVTAADIDQLHATYPRPTNNGNGAVQIDLKSLS